MCSVLLEEGKIAPKFMLGTFVYAQATGIVINMKSV
jgi:hypothetical protein